MMLRSLSLVAFGVAASSTFATGGALAQDALAQGEAHSGIEDRSPDRAAIEPALRKLVGIVRTRLQSEPSLVLSRVEAEIDPVLDAHLELDQEITAMLPNSVAHLACLGDDLWFVGFYDPLTHIWVLVSIDDLGNVRDARLGRGLPMKDGSSSWWPHLMASEGGARPALQRAALMQAGVFATLFPEQSCPPLDEAAGFFHAGEAAAQLFGLRAEWGEIPEDIEAQLVADVYAVLKEEPGPMRPAFLIRVSDTVWLVPFRAKGDPALIYMTSWEMNDDGAIRMRSGRPVPYLPTREGAGSLGGETR